MAFRDDTFSKSVLVLNDVKCRVGGTPKWKSSPPPFRFALAVAFLFLDCVKLLIESMARGTALTTVCDCLPAGCLAIT